MNIFNITQETIDYAKQNGHDIGFWKGEKWIKNILVHNTEKTLADVKKEEAEIVEEFGEVEAYFVGDYAN